MATLLTPSETAALPLAATAIAAGIEAGACASCGARVVPRLRRAPAHARAALAAAHPARVQRRRLRRGLARAAVGADAPLPAGALTLEFIRGRRRCSR